MAAGGSLSSGGSLGAGGGVSSGGASAEGGTSGGGANGIGGTRGGGGTGGGAGAAGGGGTQASGGSSARGGSAAAGGASRTGGASATGGRRGTGAAAGSGGASTTATGAGGGSGGTTSSNTGGCSIAVTSKTTSPQMATVGVIEWSATIENLSRAQIVYTLDNAGSGVLNKGGNAPVDLTKPNYRTLLLGLKPSSTYTFHVEATAADGSACKSDDATLTTGTLSGAPTITRTASKPTAQAVGFVISSGGVSHSGGSGINQAFIVDADGVVVWTASAPSQSSRARLDYEGNNMWMMALNVGNATGEMRYVSMDGATKQNNVSGLSKSHHDFTVRKGGIVATMAWAGSGMDPESDLIERSPDGKVTTVFRIGASLYKGGPGLMSGSANGYHCNSILYHESDDTYTIGDRNPSCFVKVSRAGKPLWQLGGDCSGAPAAQCVSGSWSINHGHQILDNGNFLFFNNGDYRSTTPSSVLEYTLSTSGTMQANLVKSYASSSKSRSDSLGDVQRLPNGNTLVVFSNDGLIEEVDSSWNVVQTLKASSFGYADWRETLYGPPPR
ncbi:MAG: aryl-sulfate sulfotransferase [Deltaproteobacteria bacterium]|nr:aryl-sulfate sulfotransferase [Deltaproteobacteria bacterium]